MNPTNKEEFTVIRTLAAEVIKYQRFCANEFYTHGNAYSYIIHDINL